MKKSIVVNDNNFPFSAGRNPSLPDDNEFIRVLLDDALEVDPEVLVRPPLLTAREELLAAAHAALTGAFDDAGGSGALALAAIKEVYMCLTNNTSRGNGEVDSNFAEQQAGQDIGPDAPNPRPLNAYGHIIRWRETGDDPTATSFAWDIFVFGSRADQPAEVNLSGLTEDNQFASPDGLWADPRGILWIQSDDGSNVREVTNNQMLAVVQRALGKDSITPENQNELRRFLVGPVECEVTGVHMTPDNRNMFVNIQHPGENGDPANPTSTFPGGPGTRPRSTTLVITQGNGGVIGG